MTQPLWSATTPPPLKGITLEHRTIHCEDYEVVIAVDSEGVAFCDFDISNPKAVRTLRNIADQLEQDFIRKRR